jgi:predicted SprT family Zn-dependent metalloprotease
MKKAKNVSYETITQREYNTFQTAYDFFNRELFGGGLPQLLVTLRGRGPRNFGYFSYEHFKSRSGEGAAHELSLNPDHFARGDEETCSTLVHEMVHVWQYTYGTPSRNGYHNKEWGSKMKDVGLYPSKTGQPGGKETGQQMTHYIVEGGLYAQAFAQLAATGFRLCWQSQANSKGRKQKLDSKTKYTCPICEQNAWAKPGATLICGVCFEEDGEIREMVSDPGAAVATLAKAA